LQQSTKIAIALLFAYFVFTTLKGNLGKYLEVMGAK
jgi:hypothetical protein